MAYPTTVAPEPPESQYPKIVAPVENMGHIKHYLDDATQYANEADAERGTVAAHTANAEKSTQGLRTALKNVVNWARLMMPDAGPQQQYDFIVMSLPKLSPRQKGWLFAALDGKLS